MHGQKNIKFSTHDLPLILFCIKWLT